MTTGEPTEIGVDSVTMAVAAENPAEALSAAAHWLRRNPHAALEAAAYEYDGRLAADRPGPPCIVKLTIGGPYGITVHTEPQPTAS